MAGGHNHHHPSLSSEAKLCRAQATLKVRDEMIKAKNQVRFLAKEKILLCFILRVEKWAEFVNYLL